MKKLKTAVVGAGRMGRLHSRIYSQMDQVELVAIVDNQVDKARELTAEFGGIPYQDYQEILDKIDAVTLAVPTEYHAPIAEPFLSRGIPILVEKPLADSLLQARKMLQWARDNHCILQVGYSERFNPVVQAMQRLNFVPRFMEAQRISPYTFRSTDIGVVLDMMIHDIDIVLSLARSPIKNVQAVGVNVLGEHEDIANVRIQFENGCVANLTASRLALKTERKIRVFSEEAYLSLDYLKKSGTMISKTANIDMVQWLRQQQQEKGRLDLFSVDWTKLLNVETLNIDDKEPLRLEQEAFVRAIIDNSRPQVSAEDAIAAMELAERIVREIGTHQWEGSSSAVISAEHWQNKKTTTQNPTKT
ncbi:MAG: Gfo/Idh/MocA family oxidoreductase [Sedimentisphaerales bacterium]|nr:Gfo/Idh/MocA family oxidoreductase [Sedimentisphaerales bacterium]